MRALKPGTDLRPELSRTLLGRRWGHWTARYAFNRGRAYVRSRLHPEAPSLTPDAIDILQQVLRPTDVGVEWGSGNTTRWFARRTARLTSYETSPEYFEQVRSALERAGLRNVDYRLVPFTDLPDEADMHATPWVQSPESVEDGTLDYALVDSSPRGCLCARVIAKLKPGGVLVLDNANWYMPPPQTVTPAPGSVTQLLGTSGSRVPAHRCWPAFAAATAAWRSIWTSDGIQMTRILFKP